MVTTPLTDNMVAVGRRLVERLDAAGLKPEAALWLYDTDRESWKLVISDRWLRKDGPLARYRRVREALQDVQDDLRGLPLDAVMLSPPDTGTLGLLRSAMTVEGPFAELRLTGNAFDGQFIEDAYIYRLN
ncbi:MAG: hypothetical protein FJX72_12635 [Armatimonadetes bacterium]|nr:hypothetical protein [Armatimonadota bacterium]